MKIPNFPAWLLIAGLLAPSVFAEERTLTPEQMEALAKTGELEAETPERPAKLPDLTKGETLPETKDKPWTLGPTGIVGMMVGGYQGDQIQVQGTLKGSPAESKFMWGDVIVGMNGVKFQTGGHLGELIGNAIIDAEKQENGGKISFMVWRDRNFAARYGKQDVAGVDIDKIFSEARDDNTLYDWKPEEERTKEVVQMGFDKFPIDPTTLEVELKLRVFPHYADTAPYDCPKTKQILEDAWKVLEKKFVVDPENPKSGRGGIIEAIALIASGKPEHRKLVHDWVRGKYSPWRPPTEPIGAHVRAGLQGLQGLPELAQGLRRPLLRDLLRCHRRRLRAARPAQVRHRNRDGPELGGKLGPHLRLPFVQRRRTAPDESRLRRAQRRRQPLLFPHHPGPEARHQGSGDRPRGRAGAAVSSAPTSIRAASPTATIPPTPRDDSNGKNTGVAFSLKLLGDKYGAKYFAMMSSHCAFTRRGGHGHDYHGNWSSWAATLCGPEVRMLNERNLRWRRTLCRMYDGSFVYHSPTGAYKTLRDPTATEVLHQAVFLKQTIITGKDPDRGSLPHRARDEAIAHQRLPAVQRSRAQGKGRQAMAGARARMKSSTCSTSSFPRHARRSPRNSANVTRPAKRRSPPSSSPCSRATSPASATAPLKRPARLRHRQRCWSRFPR